MSSIYSFVSFILRYCWRHDVGSETYPSDFVVPAVSYRISHILTEFQLQLACPCGAVPLSFEQGLLNRFQILKKTVFNRFYFFHKKR